MIDMEVVKWLFRKACWCLLIFLAIGIGGYFVPEVAREFGWLGLGAFVAFCLLMFIVVGYIVFS